METNEIEEALIKKAVGFLAEEVIEEFAIDETGNSVFITNGHRQLNVLCIE